ncbi:MULTISPECIES: RagB/SusD family nutrient uptake outer membrane protein [Sphingobacterium]|uniref:RagB/SusD family nutrient uptake outer membrane protein n=1 Tax=Sphingobacterium TaxID=28453 RepID=UPI0013DA3D4E|nr:MULTISPECIES: RagB/SusD family nutrient uptake outer membrane protein [unclassified Sphingobacterium]
MKSIVYILGIILLTALTGCEKLLETKPDKKLATPNSLKALRALLDDYFQLNYVGGGLGEASADNYYLDQKDFDAQSSSLRNTYTWEAEISSENVYEVLYKRINVTNVVLDELKNLPETGDAGERREIRGQALFVRAYTYLILATTFTKQYDKGTAAGNMGLALRLSSNFNDKSVRSSLEETYRQIEKDALEAVDLLPEFPAHQMRGSKWAAYAFLSRMYLAMKNYEKAELYADMCLSLSNRLMDYNELDEKLRYPIPTYNVELIYYTYGSSRLPSLTVLKIPSELYDLYEEHDRRKVLFFKENQDGTKAYCGGYTGSSLLFTGISVDEVYLTKAECLARMGDSDKALEVLNALLLKRYVTGEFVEKQAANAREALKLVLDERRKELLMRDLRWMDLKRLNTEVDLQKTLTRTIDGRTIELLPNENRYALPFPNSVIQITGMKQNER